MHKYLTWWCLSFVLLLPQLVFASSSLTDLTIPEDWQLIQDPAAFAGERQSHIDGMDLSYRYFDTYCYDLLKDWQQNVTAAAKQDRPQFQHCQQKLVIYGYVGFLPDSKQIPPEMHELLLHWSQTRALLPPVDRQEGDFVKYAHDTNAALGTLAAYYGLFYDYFPYDEEQRAVVEQQFVNSLLYVEPKHLVPYGKAICNEQSIAETAVGLSAGRISSEACGAVLWAQVQGQLLLGLQLNNQALFDKGIHTLQWLLNFFDEDGIYVPFVAGKGAHTLDYMRHVPHFLGVLTEIFATLGYDFLQHQVPAGITIKEVLDGQVKIFQEPTLLLKYNGEDKRRYGQISWRRDPMQNLAVEKRPSLTIYSWSMAEFKRWLPVRARQLVSYSFEQFARQASRYVDSQRPDIAQYRSLDYVAYAGDANNIHMLGRYSAIDPYMLYEANYLAEQGLQIKQKPKQKAGAGYVYTPKTKAKPYVPASKRETAQSITQRLDTLSIALTGMAAEKAALGKDVPLSNRSNELFQVDWYLVKAGMHDEPANKLGSDQIQLSDKGNELVVGEDHFFPGREYRQQLEIWSYTDQTITMQGELNASYHGIIQESFLRGSLKTGFGYGPLGAYGDILVFMIHD